MLKKILVDGKFHKVVMKRDEDFIENELLHVFFVELGFRFDGTGPGEDFDFLVGHDIREVVLCLLIDLDPKHQYFQFLLVVALLLKVLQQVLDQLFLRVVL